MGKNSEYNRKLREKTLAKLHELEQNLPRYAVVYLDDRELTCQPNTALGYAYDIRTFFNYLKENNPLCKNYEIKEKSLIRITRNADIDTETIYDEDLDYRDAMENLIKQRRRMNPVRMELSRELNKKMISSLCKELHVDTPFNEFAYHAIKCLEEKNSGKIR